ncbi:uncharacterized protein LOC135924684 [Gordionus sp. m RMFG-2023]|uniref:uncharacterized protein LOC135924684 n=1 Tax=Gordionus sp. m RMFG-2023 TaxID=3053472 RepID=UPI0031FDD860
MKKSWVVKPGMKYGSDFVLYEDGGPEFYHARYSVLVKHHKIPKFVNSKEYNFHDKCLDPFRFLSLKSLGARIRVTISAGKSFILALVIEYVDAVSLKKSFSTSHLDYLSKFYGKDADDCHIVCTGQEMFDRNASMSDNMLDPFHRNKYRDDSRFINSRNLNEDQADALIRKISDLNFAIDNHHSLFRIPKYKVIPLIVDRWDPKAHVNT